MDFICNGQRYSTAELISLSPGDGLGLRLYLTRDYQCVLALRFEREAGVTITQLEPVEIQYYLEKYPFPELARALELA